MPRKRKRDIYGRVIGYTRTNPVARINGKPKKAYIVHGSKSSLLEMGIDTRTIIGRKYKTGLAELRAHAGGDDITAVQARLVDQTVRLDLLADLGWAELMKSGLVVDGVPAPTANIFLHASRQYRDILLQLGVERRRKPIKLQDYLRAGEVHSESVQPEEPVLEDCEQ
jgi:hypothetical protein